MLGNLKTDNCGRTQADTYLSNMFSLQMKFYYRASQKVPENTFLQLLSRNLVRLYPTLPEALLFPTEILVLIRSLCFLFLLSAVND